MRTHLEKSSIGGKDDACCFVEAHPHNRDDSVSAVTNILVKYDWSARFPILHRGNNTAVVSLNLCQPGLHRWELAVSSG